MTTPDPWHPTPATAELMQRAATVSRERLARRLALAAEHLRRLELFGRTPATCPVCDDCPDWLTVTRRIYP